MIFVRIIAICLVVLFARYCFGKFLKTEKGIKFKDWYKWKSKYKTQKDIIQRISQWDMRDHNVSIYILNNIDTKWVKTYWDLIRILRKYKDFLRKEIYKQWEGIDEKFKINNLTYEMNATIWNNHYPDKEGVNPFLEALNFIKHYNQKNKIEERVYSDFIESIPKNKVTINELLWIIIKYCDTWKKFSELDCNNKRTKNNHIDRHEKNEYLENLVKDVKFDYKYSKEYEKILKLTNWGKIMELSDIYTATTHVLNLLDNFSLNELSLYPHIEKELPDTLDKFRRLEPEPKKEKRKENRKVDDETYYAIYHHHYEEK